MMAYEHTPTSILFCHAYLLLITTDIADGSNGKNVGKGGLIYATRIK